MRQLESGYHSAALVSLRGTLLFDRADSKSPGWTSGPGYHSTALVSPATQYPIFDRAGLKSRVDVRSYHETLLIIAPHL